MSENAAPQNSDRSPAVTPDPWDEVIGAQESFLTHLECITEMFGLVLPVLENRDQERTERIRSLSEEIETEQGKARRLTSIDHLKEVLGHLQKMRQAERLFRQSIVISIVSKFDEFLIKVLKIAYCAHPAWLKNPDKKITYKELLEIKSLDTLKEEIIEREVDSLMRDSHFEQVSFLDGKLKLGIEAHFDKWREFLEITERRNLFVHTGGIVSSTYLTNCSKWHVPVDKSTKEGSPLHATDDYISRASDCFYELSVRIAQAVGRRMFPDGLDDFDKRLNNRSVELLVNERWALAERIFQFAVGIPKELRGRDETRYYFHINHCIALKFAGKDFATSLASVDWAPFHPKYHFAVAILEDRFDDAERLMRTEAVQSEVDERSFKKWPLLREFRKTDGFQQAFRDIFKKDYSDEVLQDAKAELEAESRPDSAAPCTPSEEHQDLDLGHKP